MNDDYKFPINFLENGNVVTKDDEHIGTWGTDESDAFFEFTPNGASEPLFSDPFMGSLAQSILQWLDSESLQ
ncbi:hypothetical protein RA28_16435 [Ruegeria sp. ANG-S4]|uniref:hypothetical protein n=1 Tax=Ruegeria sp. ANG-S4 TaxID=1577904 RepID=UPI000583E9C6|nr:hypothetical protein [Ruegeria sp. ANG-S4]KIC44493.1 hypothetical protein RA28_16435 [Ruegeria sp. ANG-S4]